MPWDEAEVCRWTREVILAWREGQASAAPGPWYVDLTAPVQAEVLVCRSSTSPVEATCVLFRRDLERSDMLTDCRILVDPPPPRKDEDPFRAWTIEELRKKVGSANTNWSLGSRYGEVPLWKLVFQSRLDEKHPVHTRAWFVARPLDVLPPMSEFVRLPLGTAGEVPAVVPAVAVPPPSPVEHIRAVHENEREIEAFVRWVGLHDDELMEVMGVGSPWWLGLFLDRKDVFGEAVQGDIDFLGGPLEWSLSTEQWAEHLAAVAKKCDPSLPHERVMRLTAERAAQNGAIVWPPRLDVVVAGEIKVAWFNPTEQDMKARERRKREARGELVPSGKWHGVHGSKGIDAKRELQILVDHGFERVTFFHLAGTAPQPSDSPWIDGLIHADAAEQKMTMLFDPAEMPTCGYLTAVIGAVRHKHEGLAGSGGSLRVVRSVPDNPVRATWKAHLRAELGKLPRPTIPESFVRTCPQCGTWHSLRSPVLPGCP